MAGGRGDAWTKETLVHDEALQETSHRIALQPVETGSTTVRIQSVELPATGRLLIEARDLNEAIQVPARIPLAEQGVPGGRRMP
jgi:hypothetical protein